MESAVVRYRIISQVLFLTIFVLLFLLTNYRGFDEIRYPVRIFLEFDPLIAFTTLLAAHHLPTVMLFSLAVVGSALVLGRVFCGWVCPLGTIHHFVSWLYHRKKKNILPRSNPLGYRIKYYLLFFILASSLFTLQSVGFFDPISLLIRSMTLFVEPLVNLMVHSIFGFFYDTEIRWITALTEPIYSLLKNNFLSFRQPYFHQALFIGFLFVAILLMNFYRMRFWCFSLCPLGALLGLVSQVSLLRRWISEACTKCDICFSGCQALARGNQDKWLRSECLVCGNCQNRCPEGAVDFGLSPSAALTKPGPNLIRRNLLVSAASGIVAVPFLRMNSRYRNPNPKLIRPPGALEEGEFLKRCLKCGECMKVCLTNGLQPTLMEAGLEGIWSPILIPRLGYCQFYCTLCGQVCPSGAIKKLTVSEKVQVRIGLAFIDKNRCLPYSQGIDCIVCEEHCPTPKKAIWFIEKRVEDRGGIVKTVKQPVVDLELCTGCGICENKCPVVDKPAIVVTSIGESRSGVNRLSLY